MKQDDVADPLHPKATGSVRIGGIVARSPHPSSAESLNGGPPMVEVSRDGRRIYFTNSLYGSWDRQFYPDGIQGWMVKLDADRKSVVWGKRVSVRVDRGGRRNIKKKK